MFTCPNCGLALKRVERDYGVIWVCPTCNGRAVTIPLLERTVLKDCVIRLWRAAHHDEGAPGRPCPACGRQMREVQAFADVDAPKLDVCKTCQFVWFDRNEYENLPAARPPSQQTEALPQKAREILALHEVERIAEDARRDVGHYPDELWRVIPAAFGLPVVIEEDASVSVPWLTWILIA